MIKSSAAIACLVILAVVGVATASEPTLKTADFKSGKVVLPISGDKRHQQAKHCSISGGGITGILAGFDKDRRGAWWPTRLGVARLSATGRVLRHRTGRVWKTIARNAHERGLVVLDDGGVLVSRKLANRTIVWERFTSTGRRDLGFGTNGRISQAGLDDIYPLRGTGGFVKWRNEQGAAAATLTVFGRRGNQLAEFAVVGSGPGSVEWLVRSKEYLVTTRAPSGEAVISKYAADGVRINGFVADGMYKAVKRSQFTNIHDSAIGENSIVLLVSSREWVNYFTEIRVFRLVKLKSDGTFVSASPALDFLDDAGDAGAPESSQRSIWLLGSGQVVYYRWERNTRARGSLRVSRWDPTTDDLTEVRDQGPADTYAPFRGIAFDAARAELTNDEKHIVICGSDFSLAKRYGENFRRVTVRTVTLR